MSFTKKDYIKLSIMCFCFLVFIFLSVIILNVSPVKLDMDIINFIQGIRTPFLTSVMKIFTFLCSTRFMILLAILILIFLKNKKKAIIIAVNLALVSGANQLVKLIFRRTRPIDYMIINETGYSFPSGHSVVSMIFYGLIIYLINKSNLSKKIKVLLNILLVFLIFMIGISRIYLSVHYFTDVVGGFSIALTYLMILTLILDKKFNI